MKLSKNILYSATVFAVFLSSGSFLLWSTPVSANASEYSDITSNAIQNETGSVGLSMDEIEEYLALEDLEYYAYMNLNEAKSEIKPVIQEARNRIIFNTSWVADEINGRIRDEDGNIIEILPHFSELFPSDWQIPTISDALSTECCS